jgi:hypothetical protein
VCSIDVKPIFTPSRFGSAHANIDTLLQKVGGERVPQRMRRHPLLDPHRIRRIANNPIELACRDRQQGIAAGEQPRRRLAHAPPLPQQLQEPRRQHAVAILLAFTLLDAQHHALAIDIRHLEVGDLGYTQACAIGHTESSLVLRPGRSLQEPEDFICRQNHRQLLRLLREPQMAGQLWSIAGRREKEPQRRHRAVHGRRLYALLALTNLEHTQILPLGRVR